MKKEKGVCCTSHGCNRVDDWMLQQRTKTVEKPLHLSHLSPLSLSRGAWTSKGEKFASKMKHSVPIHTKLRAVLTAVLVPG